MITQDDIDAFDEVKVEDTIYFHSNGSMVDDFREAVKDEFEPTDGAINNAYRVGYEIDIEGYWTQNGDFYATKFCGFNLEQPVQI